MASVRAAAARLWGCSLIDSPPGKARPGRLSTDLLQALLDALAALDQLALRERRGLLGEAERALEPPEVEREHARIEADVACDAIGVVLREIAVDARDLLEEVDFGREARGGAVEEDHVLH